MSNITKTKITQISKELCECNKILKERLFAFSNYKISFNPNFGPQIDIDLSDIKYEDCIDKFDESTEEYIYCDISTAITKYSSIFLDYFSKLIKSNENKYISLNTALFNNGVFIYIRKNFKDIKIKRSKIFHSIDRTLIVLDENSSLKYDEVMKTLKGSFCISVVEIFLNKNSKLIYSTRQNFNSNVSHLSIKRAICDHSKIIINEKNIGSNISMSYPKCILKNKCYGKINIDVKSSKNSIKDVGYNIKHVGSNSKSIVNFNGYVKDGSSLTCRGNVIIDDASDKCVSTINSKMIVEDSTCVCNVIPVNISCNKSSYINYNSCIND